MCWGFIEISALRGMIITVVSPEPFLQSRVVCVTAKLALQVCYGRGESALLIFLRVERIEDGKSRLITHHQTREGA